MNVKQDNNLTNNLLQNKAYNKIQNSNLKPKK